MTTVLQFHKNIQKLDILLNQLQTAFPSLVTNAIRKDAVVYVECDNKPSVNESIGIVKIIEDFDDEVFDGIELQKPINLMSTAKKFENVHHWTLVCKWQYQGSYVDALKKIVVALSVVSNDPKNVLFLRVFDSTNNKVVGSTQENQLYVLQQSVIDISTETLSYLPAALEIHVKATSEKDLVTFHNITAILS